MPKRSVKDPVGRSGKSKREIPVEKDKIKLYKMREIQKIQNTLVYVLMISYDRIHEHIHRPNYDMIGVDYRINFILHL